MRLFWHLLPCMVMAVSTAMADEPAPPPASGAFVPLRSEDHMAKRDRPAALPLGKYQSHFIPMTPSNTRSGVVLRTAAFNTSSSKAQSAVKSAAFHPAGFAPIANEDLPQGKPSTKSLTAMQAEQIIYLFSPEE